MKYWVYINDKVAGPYGEDKLVTLDGFTPDTLICTEEAANSGSQEWVKASNVFDFEEPEPAAEQPQEQAQAPSLQNDLTATLLEKLDLMNTQLTGLQSKLDGMQTKLEENILSQQQVLQQAHEHTDTLQATKNSEITETSSSVAPAAREIDDEPDSQEEKPLDLLDSIDLDKGGTEPVFSFDLNPAEKEQPKEDLDNTFQDLLTPSASETPAPSQTPAEQQTQQESLVDQLTKTSAESSDNVLDQVIKEKEEDEATKSKTLRWLSAAGAAALAGTASLVGLKGKKNHKSETEEPAQAAQAPEEQPADKPQENSQDTAPVAEVNAQEPDNASLVEAQEQPVQEAPAAVPSLDDIPSATADQEPTPEQAPQAETSDLPDQVVSQPAEELPSTEQEPQPAEEMPAATEEMQQTQEPVAEQTLEELAPAAPTTEPEVKQEDLITEADLQEAFTERKSTEDQSVEQLFGLASAQGAVSNANEAEQAPQESAMPEGTGPIEGSEQPQAAPANPNDLTEIELKEGSTYLISDFVPPASSAAAAAAAVGAMSAAASEPQTPGQAQEMVEQVTVSAQEEAPKPDAASEANVSQLILENTVKAKRGAALDIKTVPMVPEPAQSDRLQIEGMDDINTQHDVRRADVEPAGRTAKMVVGLLVVALLGSAIYGMLAFMNLVPPQFNIFSKLQGSAATQQQQDTQINEMLDPTQSQLPVQTVEETPAAPAVQPSVLEEVQNYVLPNGMGLKQFIESKHPAAAELITWEVSTAVDPDNYSILVKVPPENPQSFKISYRFNYNAVTKTLDPTISDAKNLLDSASQLQ